MNLPIIDSLELKNKRVLVRADLDVPFEIGKILDDSRIRNCLPTFKYVLDKGAARLLILGHIGKYEGPEKTVSTSFLRESLTQLLGQDVNFIFAMIIRQWHNLLLVLNLKEDSATGLTSWQISKFKRQASAFTSARLLNSYRKLIAIDYQIKSGLTPFSQKELLDIFLINL